MSVAAQLEEGQPRQSVLTRSYTADLKRCDINKLLAAGGSWYYDTAYQAQSVRGTATAAIGWPCNVSVGQKFFVGVPDSINAYKATEWLINNGYGGIAPYSVSFDVQTTISSGATFLDWWKRLPGHSGIFQAVKKYRSGSISVITANPDKIIANGSNTSTITVQLKDASGNNVQTGGDNVTLSTTLGALSPVCDNRNGTYNATLTSGNDAGTATIHGTVNTQPITDIATVIVESALPVQLISFNGVVKGSVIELNWKTATEVNTNIFEIERRITATWEKIGELPAGGTSNAPRDYTFVDNLKNVSNRNIRYRLKTVDNDGSYKYSSEVEVVAIPAMYLLEDNYPNPFNPQTKIQVLST